MEYVFSKEGISTDTRCLHVSFCIYPRYAGITRPSISGPTLPRDHPPEDLLPILVLFRMRGNPERRRKNRQHQPYGEKLEVRVRRTQAIKHTSSPRLMVYGTDMEEIPDHRATDRSRGPRRGRVPGSSRSRPRTPNLPDRQDSRTTDIGSAYASISGDPVSNDPIDVQSRPFLPRSISASSSSASTPSLDMGTGGYCNSAFEAFNLTATPPPIIPSGSMPPSPGFQSSSLQPILRLDMMQPLLVPPNQHHGQGYLSDALREWPQSGSNIRLDAPTETSDFYGIFEFQTSAYDYSVTGHPSYHAQLLPSVYPQNAGMMLQDQEFGRHNAFYRQNMPSHYVYSEASGPPPFRNDPSGPYNSYSNPYSGSS